MSDRFKKTLLFFLLVFLVSGGVYYFLFKGKISEIKALEQEKRLIEQEIRQISVNGDRVLEEDVAVAHARLQKEIAALSQTLPAETELPTVLHDFLNRMEEETDVEHRLFQPGTLANEGKYLRLPIKVVLMSDFSGLDRYLQELKALSVVTHIDQLTMSFIDDPTGGAGTAEGNPFAMVSTKMDLSAYVFPGGEKRRQEPISPLITMVRDPFYSELLLPDPKPSEEIEEMVGEGAAEGVAEEPPLRYEGFWQGRIEQAFISGTLVAPGEKIEGYRLVSVDAEKVVLKHGKDEKVLYLETY